MFEIETKELEDIGYIVEEKSETVEIQKARGGKFNLWIGSHAPNPHGCVREVIRVIIDKDEDVEHSMATYDIKPFRKECHGGTVFDVTKVETFGNDGVHLH